MAKYNPNKAIKALVGLRKELTKELNDLQKEAIGYTSFEIEEKRALLEKVNSGLVPLTK